MPYTIVFSRRARKQLDALSGQVQARIWPRIDALSEDPRPPVAKKMSGFENACRLRVGDYRVIYEVRDEVFVVLVVRIGHRRDVYRRV